MEKSIWNVKLATPPSSVEIKNEGRFTSTLSCAFITGTGALPIIFLLRNDSFSPSQYPYLMSCDYMKRKPDFGPVYP